MIALSPSGLWLLAPRERACGTCRGARSGSCKTVLRRIPDQRAATVEVQLGRGVREVAPHRVGADAKHAADGGRRCCRWRGGSAPRARAGSAMSRTGAIAGHRRSPVRRPAVHGAVAMRDGANGAPRARRTSRSFHNVAGRTGKRAWRTVSASSNMERTRTRASGTPGEQGLDERHAILLAQADVKDDDVRTAGRSRAPEPRGVPASPTTARSGCRLRTRMIPSRTMAWSSTRRSLIASGGSGSRRANPGDRLGNRRGHVVRDRNAQTDLRSTPGRRADRQPRTDCGRPFSHAREAEGVRVDLVRIESDSLVGDFEHEVTAVRSTAADRISPPPWRTALPSASCTIRNTSRMRSGGSVAPAAGSRSARTGAPQRIASSCNALARPRSMSRGGRIRSAAARVSARAVVVSSRARATMPGCARARRDRPRAHRGSARPR